MTFSPSRIPLFAFYFLILASTCWSQSLPLDLSNLLPAKEGLAPWKPVGESEQFVGMNLYELINGGAEIFHEYGFRRVLAQEYGDDHQRYISLEVYEMENPIAAYGIFSFRSGNKGNPVRIGTEAILAGHYLNVWKSRFFFTLSGVDADDLTKKGLLMIGKAVSGGIYEQGLRPEVIHHLQNVTSSPDKIWYLAGDLALANLAPFSRFAPMGFVEASAADYGESRLLLLSYENPTAAAEIFASIVDREKVSESDRIEYPGNNFGKIFSINDKSGQSFRLELVKKFILITAGAENSDSQMIRKDVRDNLSEVVDH